MLLYMRGGSMSKWHSLLEIMQFPLKILFIGTLLLGIGTVVLNQNVAFLWHLDQQLLIKLFELLRYIGASVIYLFPMLVFVQVLSHRYESSILVIIGVLSVVLINITMVFFLNPEFSSYFYESIFNFTTIDFDKINGTLFSTRSPYNVGILSYILGYVITHYCYMRSRKYSIFGITSFVDHDAMAGIMSSVASILCGIALAYIWPFVIQGMNAFYGLIANDISNPVNLFFYGISERLSALFGLLDIPREIFWFSDMGGSWLNNVGLKFSGDVAIWTAQREADMSSLTAGTFITPYYVINLFIIPAYYVAYLKLTTDKNDRKRYLGFFIIAVALSILCGNPFPSEILMVILSPMLYVFYLFIIGLLYAFLQISHIVIGYHFNELMILANPGSGLDLLEYLRNPYLANSVYKLLAIGFVVAIIFYYLTNLYFKKYAFGLFNVVDKDKICADIVEKLGGLENIIETQSTIDKLTVKFVNREIVNYEGLRQYGAYLMLESKNGYLIRIGNISTMIKEYIDQEKKNEIETFEAVVIKESAENQKKEN